MLAIRIVLAFSGLLVLNCTGNPAEFVPHIEGYWQIEKVEQNRELIKAYTINASIDYFHITGDGQGFRKKVSPTLTGTFEVSDHSIPFRYVIENDSLNLYYSESVNTYKETIEKASETELVITNARGFRYRYIPFNTDGPNHE